MSSNRCSLETRVRALVARHADDRITFEEKRELASHVADCAACSAVAARLDASLLFLPLSASLEPASSDELDARRFAAATLAAIERSERVRLRAPSRRPVLRAASFALLAGTLVALFATRNGSAPVSSASSTSPVPSSIRPALPEPLRAENTSARPLIEEVRNPGARVYQFAASSPKDPNVVFVANPNADL